MPRYDFRCTSCGRQFELSRPFSQAADPAQCPDDGSPAERVFSMPMTFVKGDAGTSGAEAPSPAADGGHGHSHGPGGHSHGPGGHTH